MVLIWFWFSVGSTLIYSVWLWYLLVWLLNSFGMVLVLAWYCYGKLLAWIWYYLCMVLVLFLVLCLYGVGMGLAWFSCSFSLVWVLPSYDVCTVLVFL